MSTNEILRSICTKAVERHSDVAKAIAHAQRLFAKLEPDQRQQVLDAALDKAIQETIYELRDRDRAEVKMPGHARRRDPDVVRAISVGLPRDFLHHWRIGKLTLAQMTAQGLLDEAAHQQSLGDGHHLIARYFQLLHSRMGSAKTVGERFSSEQAHELWLATQKGQGPDDAPRTSAPRRRPPGPQPPAQQPQPPAM